MAHPGFPGFLLVLFLFASYSIRKFFGSSSGILRYFRLFSRRTPEADPKPLRSRPEAVPKKHRSRYERNMKPSRRNTEAGMKRSRRRADETARKIHTLHLSGLALSLKL